MVTQLFEADLVFLDNAPHTRPFNTIHKEEPHCQLPMLFFQWSCREREREREGEREREPPMHNIRIMEF